MSVKDFFDSLVGRLSNPLVGNYLVALALINWRVFLYFFAGNETIDWRILQIERYLSSHMFFYSFVFAFVAFTVYTFAIPFIVTFLKKIQNKVNVYVLRNELAFERRLENEKRLGGSSEVIAACLKKELLEINKYLKDVGDFIRVKTIPSNAGSQGESDILIMKNGEFVLSTDEILSKCSDILDSNYGRKTSDLMQEFLDARNKR